MSPVDEPVQGWDDPAYAALLEAAPDALLVADPGGVIVLVNAAAERLFGYPREELLGRSVDSLVPSPKGEVQQANRAEFLRDPSARPMAPGKDLLARRKDGSHVPVEVSISPVTTRAGLHVCASVRDVSERRRLRAEAERVKDEYFATVSHELRTPLTSMLGYAELLEETETLTADGRHFLEAIIRGARRELRLVNDLLTLATIEQSGLTVDLRPVDVVEVVGEAVDSARPRAEDAGVRLVAELPDRPALVAGDRDRIGQAVDNLVSNALKFCQRSGRVVVRVALGSGTTAGTVAIDVVDDGPGLASFEATQVFERLYRGADAVAAHIPGAGLGLTITRAIVERHSGRVGVHETGPAGTTFRIELPVLRTGAR